MPRMNANLAQSRGNPVHFCTQNYRSLILGYQKGKMAENRNHANTGKIGKESSTWLGRVSKTKKILTKNRRSEIFSKNGRFFGISAIYFKDNFSRNFPGISNIQKGCLYESAKQKVIGVSIGLLQQLVTWPIISKLLAAAKWISELQRACSK